MTTKHASIKINHVVEYRTFTGEIRAVVVESLDDDVKNGRPGFSGRIVIRLANGKWGKVPPPCWSGVWGYSSDVVATHAEGCS
jgi:hypothetical protein